MRDYNRISRAEEALKTSKDHYLTARGWQHTCRTPGSMWLWERVYQGRTIMAPLDTAFEMQAHIDTGIYDSEEPR
jgi:hypothetical protein